METEDNLIEWPEFSNQLTQLFPKLRISKDGRVYETKELVGKINALKIYIYPKDHDPPHFHVRGNNGEIDLSFRLDNGQLTKGKCKNKADFLKIEYFYQQNKSIMLKKWNEFQNII